MNWIIYSHGHSPFNDPHKSSPTWWHSVPTVSIYGFCTSIVSCKTILNVSFDLWSPGGNWSLVLANIKNNVNSIDKLFAVFIYTPIHPKIHSLALCFYLLIKILLELLENVVRNLRNIVWKIHLPVTLLSILQEKQRKDFKFTFSLEDSVYKHSQLEFQLKEGLLGRLIHSS